MAHGGTALPLNVPQVGVLEDQAQGFASRLTQLVNATVTTGCSFHVTIVDGLAVFRPPGEVFVTKPVLPLSTSPDPDIRTAAPLWLRVHFVATLDDEGEYLAVQTSVMGLCVDRDSMRGPMRIEYDRDKVGKQAAHLQLDADSAALGYAYARAGQRLRPLHKLHIPLGDRRFRPSLEDFIEFLVQEDLVTDLHAGWQQAVDASRGDWLERQTRAAVRRQPVAAAAQLEAMGYTVAAPGSTPQGTGAAEPLPREVAQVALDYVDAIMSGRFEDMWAHMDDNLRLCEAQLWVHANRDHDLLAGEELESLAQELASPQSDHPLRSPFETARIQLAPEHFPPFVSEGRAGVASNRRRVAADLDVLLLLDPDQVGGAIPSDALVGPPHVHALLVRFQDRRWLVAGHGYNPPAPGWPPTSGSPTGLSD